MTNNLGEYLDITVAAKAAGGVPELIASIQKNAVSGATPRLVVFGTILGVVGTVAGSTVVRKYRVYRATQELEAAKAEAVITASVNRSNTTTEGAEE